MIIKSKDWAGFKEAIIDFIRVFNSESHRFVFSEDNHHDFSLFVGDCQVFPVFSKKDEFQKVEYDFTNCEIEIRTLSFSRYKDAARVEMTIKKKKNA